MSMLEELRGSYSYVDQPCLISRAGDLHPSDVLRLDEQVAEIVKPGDVVALVGDFDARSIRRMLTIIDKSAIYVPLTDSTRPQHPYFLETAHVDVLVDGNRVERLRDAWVNHPMLDQLRRLNRPGLVLFSSGTTGQPKAILHNFEKFLVRFRTPRPTLRTLSFLLFDHIGGVNTLLHTLYNKGTIIFPTSRRVSDILDDIKHFNAEVLPTTPTFLRMILLSGELENADLGALRIITYGTERMDEATLEQLCKLLPDIDFRQTYGMSELGILRVKSVARNSLWMHVGGEGVETKIVDGVLKIRSENRMIGYLNANSPFDDEGWYDTKDLVEVCKDGAIRISGRTTEWINIGGEKVLPETIEQAALEHPDILHAQAKGVENPITGQYIELLCQPREQAKIDKKAMKYWLKERLPAAFIPQRIKLGDVNVTHRFKKI